MKALKPSDIPQAFAVAFNSGQVENLLALYEPQAKVVKAAEPSVSVKDMAIGLDAISKEMAELLRFGGECESRCEFAIEFENLALVRNDWVIRTKNQNDEPLEIKGQSTEIIRQQADGAWLYVVDHPFGAITQS